MYSKSQNFNLELHKKYLALTTNNAIHNYGLYQTEISSIFIHGMYWILCCSDLIKFDILNEPNILDDFNDLLRKCERELYLDNFKLKTYSINPSYLISPSILSLLSGIQINTIKENKIVEANKYEINSFVKSLITVTFEKIYINNSKNCLDHLDIRFIYSALLASYLTNYSDLSQLKSVFPIAKLIDVLNSLQNIDGGFGRRHKDESHAGYTFCAVASIAIIKRIIGKDTINLLVNFTRLTRWLLKRIIVSEGHKTVTEGQQYCFNGRAGKKCDVCYSWWVIASLKIVESINSGEIMYTPLTSNPKILEELIDGILCHQDNIYGGFQKVPYIFDNKDRSDPLHTFLAISALSLLTNNNLKQLGLDLYETTKLSEISSSIVKIDPVSVLAERFFLQLNKFPINQLNKVSQ